MFSLFVLLRCLVLLTPAAILPPVSTIPTVSVAKFAAGVVDTGGKFATGVVDTVGAPWAALLSFWLFYPFGKVTRDVVSPSASLYMYSILFWPFWVISTSVVNFLLCFLKEIRANIRLFQLIFLIAMSLVGLLILMEFGGWGRVFLFSVVFTPSTPSHHSNVLLLNVITLLITNTVSPVRACLPIWLKRFRESQKEDERGLLSIQSSLDGV